MPKNEHRPCTHKLNSLLEQGRRIENVIKSVILKEDMNV
jgi:hypothetical protein